MFVDVNREQTTIQITLDTPEMHAQAVDAVLMVLVGLRESGQSGKLIVNQDGSVSGVVSHEIEVRAREYRGVRVVVT